MGVRVAHNLVSASILDFIELSPDYSILEMKPLKEWIGRNLTELNLRRKYGINVMAIKKDNNLNISPRADEIVEDGDILVVIGGTEDLNILESKILKEK